MAAADAAYCWYAIACDGGSGAAAKASEIALPVCDVLMTDDAVGEIADTPPPP